MRFNNYNYNYKQLNEFFLISLFIINNANLINAGNIELNVNRWDSIVPYVIDSDLEFRRNDIETAINIIESSTNARLRSFQPGDRDWVIFQLGSGCSSFIGRRGGGQAINLAPGCSIGSIMHEILHALGGHHEHTRPDRDSFVRVNFENIQQGTVNNFIISATAQGVGPYDYNSIMHYPRTGFSSNGQDTITPLNPSAVIGQRTRLTNGDIQTFNTLYQGDTGSNQEEENNGNEEERNEEREENEEEEEIDNSIIGQITEALTEGNPNMPYVVAIIASIATLIIGGAIGLIYINRKKKEEEEDEEKEIEYKKEKQREYFNGNVNGNGNGRIVVNRDVYNEKFNKHNRHIRPKTVR